MLDGNQLEVFLAIARHRHFVRAADSLGIAQSVASKRLARLEHILGMRLIDRSSRNRIGLTRSGALFLAEAEHALEAITQAERVGRNLARGIRGPLRIGYVFSASMTGTLDLMLSALRGRLPELEIELRLIDTPKQLRWLEMGKLDVGIVRPRPAYPEALSARTAHREGVVLALSAKNPLAKRRALYPSDLAGETFIIPQFQEDVGLIDTIRSLASDARVPMPATRHADDFVSATSLAAAGAGVVLAPASLRNFQRPGLVLRELCGQDASVDLVCLLRHDTPPAASRLIHDLFSHATVGGISRHDKVQ